MGRDAADASKKQVGIDNQRSNQLNDRANYVFGQVNPFLQGEMKNPQGFGPDLAKMNTASQQSLGGGVAAATGQGNLTAARTGNVGMYAPVIGEAARAGMRQNSENSLKTEGLNAMEKKREQTEGASGLMHEGDANLQASLSALGLTTGSLQAWNAADQNTLANWMGPLQVVAQMAGGAGSIMQGLKK